MAFCNTQHLTIFNTKEHGSKQEISFCTSWKRLIPPELPHSTIRVGKTGNTFITHIQQCHNASVSHTKSMVWLCLLESGLRFNPFPWTDLFKLVSCPFSNHTWKTGEQTQVHVQPCLYFGQARLVWVCLCALGGGDINSITKHKSHKEVRDAVVAWQHRDNDYTLHEVDTAEVVASVVHPHNPILVCEWRKKKELLFDCYRAGTAWEVCRCTGKTAEWGQFFIKSHQSSSRQTAHFHSFHLTTRPNKVSTQTEY